MILLQPEAPFSKILRRRSHSKILLKVRRRKIFQNGASADDWLTTVGKVIKNPVDTVLAIFCDQWTVEQKKVTEKVQRTNERTMRKTLNEVCVQSRQLVENRRQREGRQTSWVRTTKVRSRCIWNNPESRRWARNQFLFACTGWDCCH